MSFIVISLIERCDSWFILQLISILRMLKIAHLLTCNNLSKVEVIYLKRTKKSEIKFQII